MLLRGKNFVSETKHISIIENSIRGLIDGDIYYFNVHVDSVATTFYIEVTLEAGDTVAFHFKKDCNKFYSAPVLPYETTVTREDEEIKVITNSRVPVAGVSDPKVVSFDEDPATAMAGYVGVYIDAMQTA